MDIVLQGIPNTMCYLDDIIVSGRTEEEHLQNLATVLERLQQHGMRIKKEKCKFMCTSVEYLGHRIDSEGLHATSDKLQAIVNAPDPKDVHQLRSFLGLINYYGKFIPSLASVIRPLNELLQKNRAWKWSKGCMESFKAVKKLLVSPNVLVHYDPSLPIRLAADASAYGVGAVISHVMPDNTERPIAFASRTLTSAERNYAQVEKEGLGLIFGVRKFHTYLYGRKFVLVTDHKPLTTILGPKKEVPPLAAARLQRWALILSAYKYDIEFRPTAQHANADGLSRLPLACAETEGSSSEPSIFNIAQIESLPVTAARVRQASSTDPVVSKVIRYTQGGWPTEVDEGLRPFWRRRHELTVEEGCLLWGIRVVIPPKLQAKLLEELHRDHPGVARMKSVARNYMWWPCLDQSIEELARSCEPCKAVKHSSTAVPLHPWTWPTRP